MISHLNRTNIQDFARSDQLIESDSDSGDDIYAQKRPIHEFVTVVSVISSIKKLVIMQSPNIIVNHLKSSSVPNAQLLYKMT